MRAFSGKRLAVVPPERDERHALARTEGFA
jgi:hypothetical protein